MFGENLQIYDDKNKQVANNGQIFLYVIGTNLINIIALNILISIVCENYDNVLLKI